MHFAGQLATNLALSSPVSPDAQGFVGSALTSGRFVERIRIFFFFISPFKSQQQLLLRPWKVPSVSDRRQY